MSFNDYNPLWRTWILQAIEDYEKEGKKKKVKDGKKALAELDSIMEDLEEKENFLFERGVD